MHRIELGNRSEKLRKIWEPIYTYVLTRRGEKGCGEGRRVKCGVHCEYFEFF